MDYELEKARFALLQQKATLKDLVSTRSRLISRNEKLFKAARRAFAKPIPLLKHHEATSTRSGLRQEVTLTSVLESPVSDCNATDKSILAEGDMKPKAKTSSGSSMDTDAPKDAAGKKQAYEYKLPMPCQLYVKICTPTNMHKSNPLFAGSHNASDPFFDADATVIDSDGMDTSGKSAESEGTPKKEEEKAADGEEIASRLNRMGGPKSIPEEVRRDLDGVSAAVIKAGGLVASKPQENRERRGQILEIENVDLDLGNTADNDCVVENLSQERVLLCLEYQPFPGLTPKSPMNTERQFLRLFFLHSLSGELEPLIERPAESTLKRIDYNDLLPPPSNATVPADFLYDPSMPEYVKEQKIEFLLMQRPTGSEIAWSMPSEEHLHKIWNFVRNKLDSDYILDICLWCRHDRVTGIASIMLSTVNLPVMERVRHEIRVFDEIEGIKFETYNKSLFIKRYGISMYVPKEHAGLSPQRILRALFYKQRDLYTRNVKLLSKHRFETNAPGYQLGQRSRVGDAILLFDSPELAKKLQPYDEEHRFTVSKGFNVTLKGGARGEGHQVFSAEMTSTVIGNAAAQAMRSAMDAHSQPQS